MNYGHFDDANRAYVITDPATPRPWINFLGNRKLGAFISQNAGGWAWYLESEAHRLTRYHYMASPLDRPGFYVYVKDKRTGQIWNPHFAPMCTQLDKFECRHMPGTTSFTGRKGDIEVKVDYVIPPSDNVLAWKVSARNISASEAADLTFASYLEWGILELYRELWWCYLQNHFVVKYDPEANCIRNDYAVYDAVYAPKMVLGCSEKASGYECSRIEFMGRTGSLERPEALLKGFKNSELPIGGHACGAMGVDMKLKPGESRQFVYVFAFGDTFDQADALLRKYASVAAFDSALMDVRAWWNQRFETLQAKTGDEMADRFINTWNPYQSLTITGLPCSISTEHMGINGLLYRDMSQYALPLGNFDPQFAGERIAQILTSQTKEGMGCCQFFPHTNKPPVDVARRSDNTVWQIYTVMNMLRETGDLSYLDQQVPYREGDLASIYDHMLNGLKFIYDRRGPQGMPLMYDADWNDALSAWIEPHTESIMLGMQLIYSCQLLADLARRLGRQKDVDWCFAAVKELDSIINSDKCWDGLWYRRLLLAGGKALGTKDDVEGKLWLNTQSWSLICGSGWHQDRGRIAMDQINEHLDSPAGIVKQWPAIGSVYPKIGMRPGVGEFGGVFNHSNTWVIMAECMLGNNDRAFKYYRQIIPAVVSEKFGPDHYQREPYVYVSAVVGPVSELFGQGGIPWNTGAAGWMYIAATQYILGVRPTFEGLSITPCLPSHLKDVQVKRRFRGCMYDIRIDNQSRKSVRLEVNGRAIDGSVVPIQKADACTVKCFC